MLVQMSLQAGLEQVSALVAVIFANHDHILFRKSLGQLRYGNRRAGYGLDHGGMIVGLWWRRFRCWCQQGAARHQRDDSK